jgi:hypothetical protein
LLATGRDNTLTELDKNSIKYIAYTAPEPYRSVYLEYVGSYKIGSLSGVQAFGKKYNNAHYENVSNKIFFTDVSKAFSKDERGAYTTWFHESGHATDCNAYRGMQFFCLNFTTYNEEMGETVTLQDAIYYDVYNNIEDKIEGYTQDEQAIVKILKTFKYGINVSDLSECSCVKI